MFLFPWIVHRRAMLNRVGMRHESFYFSGSDLLFCDSCIPSLVLGAGRQQRMMDNGHRQVDEASSIMFLSLESDQIWPGIVDQGGFHLDKVWHASCVWLRVWVHSQCQEIELTLPHGYEQVRMSISLHLSLDRWVGQLLDQGGATWFKLWTGNWVLGNPGGSGILVTQY